MADAAANAMRVGFAEVGAVEEVEDLEPQLYAPATDTMLFALNTCAGVNLKIGIPALALGAVLVAGGYALRRS